MILKNIYPSLCESPLQDECNLVCGGDFENPFTNMQALSEYEIWPGIIDLGFDNSPDIALEGTNHFARMGFGASYKHEGFSLEFSETLLPDTNYELTLKLRKKDTIPTYIDIVTSENMPCSSTETNAMYGPAYECADASIYFGEIISIDHEITSEDWYQVSINFTPTEPANYISLFNSFSNSDDNSDELVSVDDIFIQKTELFADAGEDVEICLGESTLLGGTPTVNGNSTFLWEGTDGSTYSTSNPGVAPQTTTLYNVFVTSNNCSVIGSDYVIVTVEDCCPVPNNALDFSNEFSSSYGPSVVDEIIYINEVFTVNSDFSFSSCTIYLGEDAKIDVIDAWVDFRNSTLQACNDKMWDGVYADNANEGITFSGSTASGAKNAINAQNNAGLSVADNSELKNNHIGILLKHYNNAGVVSIYETIFLKTEEDLLAPFSGGFSRGIKAINVNNLTIGSYNYPNNFNGLTFGIDLLDVALVSKHNVFTDCYTGIGKKLNPTIDGITNQSFLDNNKLQVTGCTFSSVNYGVQAYGYILGETGIELLVSGCEFNNCSEYAIRAERLGAGCSIKGNTFTDSQYGVYLANPSLAGSNYSYASVVDNTLNHIERYAIWTSGLITLPSSGNIFSITSNTINYTPSNTFRTGINVEYCDKISINRNTITRNNLPTNAQEMSLLNGIWIEETHGAKVYDNTITRMGHGIHGIGMLNETQFSCNQLNHNSHGFHFDLENQTIISDQGNLSYPSDNTWLEPNFNFMRIQGEFNFPLPNWYYRTGNLFDAFSSSTQSINYFNYATGPINCDWNYSTLTLGDSSLAELLKVAEGNYEYEQYDEEYKHREKKKAYYKLRKDSTLYANEVVLQNFVALMENSPLEKILNVNDKMTALDFEAALLENQEIISDKLYIQNRKTVNTIYLNLLQNGNVLSSEDSLSLQNIALITPYLGGDAVYSARILLGIDAMDYGIQYRGEGTSIEFEPTQSGVNVYPNPVQNQLHIDILKPVTEQVFVRVYNSTGTELAYNKVNGITGTINTEQFAAGIYLYKVYTLNKILQQGKFIKLPTISR